MSSEFESMTDLASYSLGLVQDELNSTLDAARREIEAYVDGQSGPEGLLRAASMLHLASGALKIVEVHGAALLADEMEQTCRFLTETQDQVGRERGLEALTRAMVQLPAYLDRLLSGGRDVAIVLLPLLNDLRTVRGKPLMSEGTLLLLRTGPLERAASPASRAGGQAREEFRKVAYRERPGFQTALLGWIRGDSVESNLDELISISGTLEQAAGSARVQQLWGVLCGIFVAVRAGGLDPSVALKRLIGQADRQLKRLIDHGEEAYDSAPPVDLLNNLLYHISRADSEDERIRLIRSEFNLDALPGQDQLEQAREGISGPSVKLMRTVAAAIKQDLGAVKDSLDIFVRTGMDDYRQLLPQLEMLRKIGDTLGVLGLTIPQQQIADQMARLSAIIDASEDIDQEKLEGVAAVLLAVEDDLDKELVRAVVPADGSDAQSFDEAGIQYSQVTQAVMGECIVNLAKVKEAIVKLVDSPADGRVLDNIKPQLRGIAAGLLMLNKTTAVRVIERIGRGIAKSLGSATEPPDPVSVERLADAIVSVEYYMETVSAGRTDPWYMLENAGRCLDLLDEAEVRGAPAPIRIPDLPDPASIKFEETGFEDVFAEAGEMPVAEEDEGAEEALPAESLPQATPSQLPATSATRAALQTDGERLDPELVEVFIEEAREEIDRIKTIFPAWYQNHNDVDALTATRRSFHTLKGSGRTVGALMLGDFAWSIENLLNRLINRTLKVTMPIAELVKEAVAALPALIDHLELGIEPTVDIAAISRQAAAFSAGEGVIGEAATAAEAGKPEAAVADIDPVLAEIFVKEMRGHLGTIRRFIDDLAVESESHVVDEVLYRASHTLLGSANMANYEPCIMVAEPLADFLGHLYESGLSLDSRGLAALRRAAEEIGAVADALHNESVHLPDRALIAELDELVRRAAAESSRGAPIIFEPPELPSQPPGAQQPAEPPVALEASNDALSLEEASSEGRSAVSFDPEIAAIFTEESTEHLDEIESLVQDLRQGTGGESTVGELQRLLHTLKGGARMAGIAQMGDLSHALETFLSRFDRPHAIGAAAIGLIQRAIDALQHMRDCVDLSKPFDDYSGLFAQLAAAAPDGGTRVVEDETLQTSIPEGALDESSKDDALTRELPQLDVAEFEPPHGKETWKDELELTGTMEFSDEEMQELERLAFEEAPTADADILEELPTAAGEEEEARPPPSFEMDAPDVVVPLDKPRAAEPAAETLAASAEAPTGPVAPPAETARVAERADIARVDAQLLEALLNSSGEISIFQARLNQQLRSIDFHLGELGQTVTRLRDQLRKLEAETEAQILHQHQDDAARGQDFDPLELDRYSTIQQLSRALAETASDVGSINELLLGLTNEADTLLGQQGRVTAEIQDGLMKTRMVPFQRHVARLARVVRQASADTGKNAELSVGGASNELDRQVLDAMLPAFEHILRNSVVHGIESAHERRGKPEIGQVRIDISREGAEVSIAISDDGAGLDIDAIRRTAVERGFAREDQALTDRQAIDLIFKPGFSTAGELTQAAGRGVGMDVVDTELKKLGGSMQVETTRGTGTKFLIRLPYTLAITHALIVDVGDETFAMPLTTVEGITRVRREHLLELLTQDDPRLEYGDTSYRLQHLGSLVGSAPSALVDEESAVALVLIRAGENSTALLTDRLEGSREVVVKGLGPHIASIPGVTGATILGDGRVIIILDVGTLIREQPATTERAAPAAVQAPAEQPPTALVVDDSITMRRVTERLLERRGVRVLTARDGLDAVRVLQEHEPDIILLDIEMPRMDGYQFAAHVRNDPKLSSLPIIMITSRSGEKHRAKAIELGVNDYLSKPYQENQLVAAIEAQLGRTL